jgi:membrane fusion protein (multidrug efflux system)
VTLAAEVEGPIVAIAVEEHSMVEAGAVLVQVERSLLEAAVERQEAQLSRARADHDLAKLDLGRQLGLKEKNVGSAAELDRARAIERARPADRQQARASLTDARVRLDKATIRAPFAGVVQKLDLEPGAYLRPGDPVAEILDLSEIEIEVGVIDRQVVALRAGDPVSVLVDVFPDEVFGGVIRRLGRSPDDRTQKFPVEVRVANQDGRLLPGMLGRVRFDLGEREPAIRVPRAATRTEYEISYVFVLDGQDSPRVSRRRVATRHAPFRPDLLEVTQGLREGERIAVTRVGELRDGLRVRPLGSGG